MQSPVYFWPCAGPSGQDTAVVVEGLARLGAALDLPGAASDNAWAVKIHLGPSQRPAALDPAWTAGVVAQLGSAAAGSFLFDTLSITTPGLDQVADHLATAVAKGYGDGSGGLPYEVADDPAHGQPLVVAEGHTLAGGLRRAGNLCVLTPVRPHPHIGLRGALTTLGVGFSDREGKLALHRDIRPQVDTPLCAGCGVCMTVCLFDAIKLQAGRALIDHTLCVGCGECMNVCFMAGITPEESAGIPRFQAKVAAAALAARDAISGGEGGQQVYFNFLVRLDRQSSGPRVRQRDRMGDVGILAGRDPVAVDQATVELISERMDGQLNAWSGFNQVPDVLLARAEALGLGTTAYKLVTV